MRLMGEGRRGSVLTRSGLGEAKAGAERPRALIGHAAKEAADDRMLSVPGRLIRTGLPGYANLRAA